MAKTLTTNDSQEIKQENKTIGITTQTAAAPTISVVQPAQNPVQNVVSSSEVKAVQAPVETPPLSAQPQPRHTLQLGSAKKVEQPTTVQPPRFGQPQPPTAKGVALTWGQIEEIGKLLNTPPAIVNLWIHRYGWERFEKVTRAALYDYNIRDRGAWIRRALEADYTLNEDRVSQAYIHELRIDEPDIIQDLED